MRENLLSIQLQTEGDIGLVGLAGELIAESRYDLDRILRQWIDEELNRVIISFAGLSYIDSAGLSTLLAAMHGFRRQGGDLILAEMNPALNAIFEVASMEKYFKIFPTVDEARTHFKSMIGQRKKPADEKTANDQA